MQPIIWTVAEFKVASGRNWEDTPVLETLQFDGTVKRAKQRFWVKALELSREHGLVVRWNFLNSDQGWYADGRDAKK